MHLDDPVWTFEGEITSEDIEYLEENGWTECKDHDEDTQLFYRKKLDGSGAIEYDPIEAEGYIGSKLPESEEVEDAVDYFDAELNGGVPDLESAEDEVVLVTDSIYDSIGPKK